MITVPRHMPWMARAACRGHDPNLWFPQKAGANHNTPKAKAICATCPVSDACLQYALDAGETRGIWGGVAIDAHRRSPEHRKVPTPLPHGTNAGYVRERRQGLPHCADCIAARNRYRRALHARSAA